jgi:hypothetical protein
VNGSNDMSDRDRRPPPDPAETRRLLALSERLQAERPVPSPLYRGLLRRRLLRAQAAHPQMMRARARLLVLAYGASGAVLMLIAALGVAGAGPFAAG